MVERIRDCTLPPVRYNISHIMAKLSSIQPPLQLIELYVS